MQDCRTCIHVGADKVHGTAADRGSCSYGLSLGVENLADEVLAENGRADVSTEVYRVMPWIKSLGFDQVNVDLIAGMVGDSWERWRDTVARTIELDPDSITVYQMALPLLPEDS